VQRHFKEDPEVLFERCRDNAFERGSEGFAHCAEETPSELFPGRVVVGVACGVFDTQGTTTTEVYVRSIENPVSRLIRGLMNEIGVQRIEI
jgi:hypothetical protein